MLATKKTASSFPTTSDYNRALIAKADRLAGVPPTVAPAPKRRGLPPKHPRPETGLAASQQPQTSKAAEPNPAPEPAKNGVYLPPPLQKAAAPANPAGITIKTGAAPELKANGRKSPREAYFTTMAELKPGQWFGIPGTANLTVRERGYTIRAIRKRAARLKLEDIDVGTSVVTNEIVVKRSTKVSNG